MLYFVGVGPGDPELMTMRAVRALREADAVVLPDSGKDSVVWKIAGEWIGDKPVCRLAMPMRGSREDWEAAHRQAAEELLRLLKDYETVVYPVLGDPGIYASSSYLMKRIAPFHPCRVIPGIPAMCAAAAKLGIPLCEQGEELTVIDCMENAEVPEGNVVVMKCGKHVDAIRRLAEDREAYIVCNLGMEDEWTGRAGDLPQHARSYFMTAILKNDGK